MDNIRLTCLDCGQLNRVPPDRLGAVAKCGICGARLMPARPFEVDLATLQKAARNDTLPLVVDFWAPWCGPCRMMAPEFARAAESLGKAARLVKLNTEAHPKAGSVYGIRGIPLLAVFRGGKELARQAGAMPAAVIVEWVRRAI